MGSQSRDNIEIICTNYNIISYHIYLLSTLHTYYYVKHHTILILVFYHAPIRSLMSAYENKQTHAFLAMCIQRVFFFFELLNLNVATRQSRRARTSCTSFRIQIRIPISNKLILLFTFCVACGFFGKYQEVILLLPCK